jgi:hypothetical protein
MTRINGGRAARVYASPLSDSRPIAVTFCPSCLDFLHRHSRALRWTVVLALLIGFFFWVGANAPVTTQPFMCKVYG